jgi:uncharacterized protein with beta-barrel porin domain
VRNHIRASFAALLLSGLALALPARAQNATWNGTTSDFNSPSNWSSNAVPAGTAFFGATGSPGITFSSGAVVGGLTFNAGAQAFTFSTTTETAGLTLGGAGIVDNSAFAPAFRVGNRGIVAATPGLGFINGASAGNAAIANTDGGVTAFLGSSTAGNATIVNSGGTAFFSGTVFLGSATAGNAAITNNTGGITQFNPSASAGNATIVNNGGSLASFSIARFIDALTNPSVAPSANQAGVTAFVGTSTAGAASITNSQGGVTAFLGSSTAGAATIVTNAGGATFFTGASSGGTASLVVNPGGMLDLTAHALGSLAAGSLTLAAGSSYRINVTAAGQNNALGLGGTATLQGGTLGLSAAPGNYAGNPTYTIISAAGGVSGSLTAASSFAFLTPTLGYDAGNVYLSLSQSFARGAQTANQRAVGGALDQAALSATGGFASTIGALAVLPAGQGAAALNALSGQPYADFGTVNVQAGYAFLNAVSSQIAAARGDASASRVALAEACDLPCSASSRPVGAWMSALGGLGSVLGDGNASTLTYSLGGAAVGADWRPDSRWLLGASVGYLTGTQWVSGFDGRGITDVFNFGLYASFASAGFHADGAVGWANATNRLTRNIAIAGLATPTANGSTSANQFLGQVEAGYRIALDALSPSLSATPFARLQGSTTSQAGFGENGAGAAGVLVAPQVTNSLRSTLGADLRATIRQVDIDVRLGWLHEYADTSRPMTASFAGAPGISWTVFGATPQRDSAVIGLAATANLADATRLYLRYEGEVGGATDNHALSAGLRLSW